MAAALLILALFLQDDEARARALIDEAVAKVKDLPAIEFERETLQTQSNSASMPAPNITKILVRRPNHLRLEFSGDNSDSLWLLDGTRAHFYDRLKNEVTQIRQYPGFMGTSWDDAFLHVFTGRGAARILDGAKEIRVTEVKEKAETLDVITWKDRGRWERAESVDVTLWIGKDKLVRGYFRSHEDTRQKYVLTRSMAYSKANLAPKIPDDAFTFKPAAGVKQKKPYRSPGDEIPGGPEADKAHALLKEVHTKFAGSAGVSYEYEWVSLSPEGKEISRHTIRTDLKRPGFIRQQPGLSGASTYLCDGHMAWHLTQHMKTFKQNELIFPAHRLMTQPDPMMQLFFEGEEIELLAGAFDITLGKESVEGTPCDVLQWDRQQGEARIRNRFFFDAERRLVLREFHQTWKEQTSQSVIRYRGYDTSRTIADAEFRFMPGKDWIDRTTARMGTVYLKVGTVVPELEMVDRDDKPALLSRLRGKPVILFFAHFGHESTLDHVQKLFEPYASRDLEFVAVDYSGGKTAYDPAKHKFRLLRPKNLLDVRTFGAEMLGGVYLIDTDGKVIIATSNSEEIKGTVDRLAPPK